jgi:hypothetical protein
MLLEFHNACKGLLLSSFVNSECQFWFSEYQGNLTNGGFIYYSDSVWKGIKKDWEHICTQLEHSIIVYSCDAWPAGLCVCRDIWLRH